MSNKTSGVEKGTTSVGSNGQTFVDGFLAMRKYPESC